MIYELKLTSLDSFFAKAASAMRLYLPVDTQGGARYEEWAEGKKLSSALNTVRSAKDFFFPQTQNLVDFKVDGKNIEIIDNRSESEDFVIFGVRACDVRSFDVLDRVFLSEPVDSYYKTRREHGVVVSLACSHPEETCFCHTFDIDAAKPEGDVRCVMTEDELFIEPITEKGEKFVAIFGDMLAESDGAKAAEQTEKTRGILSRLPLNGLTAENFTEKQLEVFKSEKWAELSSSCLGCGSCTFVCPTCQCYDIKDFDTGHGVKRFRCWDSCMYSEFTKMAAGNPRLTQLEKFRQRFMHKLVYFPSNNDGMFGCVGCGRCLRKCPISMNIVKVMKALGEEAQTNGK